MIKLIRSNLGYEIVYTLPDSSDPKNQRSATQEHTPFWELTSLLQDDAQIIKAQVDPNNPHSLVYDVAQYEKPAKRAEKPAKRAREEKQGKVPVESRPVNVFPQIGEQLHYKNRNPNLEVLNSLIGHTFIIDGTTKVVVQRIDRSMVGGYRMTYTRPDHRHPSETKTDNLGHSPFGKAKSIVQDDANVLKRANGKYDVA